MDLRIKSLFSGILIAVMLTSCGATLSGGKADLVNTPNIGADNSDKQKLHTSLIKDAKVIHKVLPNGLSLFVRPHGYPEGKVEVRLVVKAGALHEPVGKEGVAHFLEHLQFNGSEHFAPGELDKTFERFGSFSGADTNASTGYEKTIYQLSVDNSSEALKYALLAMYDFAHGPVLHEQMIRDELPVIMAEKEVREDNSSKFWRLVFQQLYKGTPYTREIVGTESSLQSLTKKDFEDYLKKWYTPENMAVYVVGDVDGKEVIQMLEERFGSMKKQTTEKSPEIKYLPIDTKNIVRFVHEDMDIGSFSLRWRKPAMYQRTDAESKQSLIHSLFVSILSNRLDKVVKNTRKQVVSLEAYSSPFSSKDSMLFELIGNTISGNERLALSLLTEELLRLQQHKVSNAELKDIKDSLFSAIKEYIQNIERTPSSAIVSSLMDPFVYGNIHTWDVLEALKEMDVIKNISSEDIQKAALLYPLDQAGLSVASTKKYIHLLSDNIIQRFIRELMQKKVTQGAYVPTQDIVFQKNVERGTVVESTKVRKDGMTKTVFSNGLVLLTKPTKFIKDRFSVNGTTEFSDIYFPQNEHVLFGLLDSTMYLSGIKEATLEELEKWFQKKQLAFSVSSGGFQGSAKSDDALLFFQGLQSALFHPLLKQDALKNAKDRMIESEKQKVLDPYYYFENMWSDALYGPASTNIVFSQKEIDAVDVDQLRSFHTTYFVPGLMELRIVGDFDEATMINIVAKTLGAEPKKDVPKLLIQYGKDFSFNGGGKVSEVAKNLEKKYMSRITFGGVSIRDADFVAMHLLGNVLKRILFDEIRQALGTTYAISASHTPHILMPGGTFDIEWESSSQEEVDTSVKKILQVIEKRKIEGFSEDELLRAKEPIIQSFATALNDNTFYLFTDGNSYLNIPYDFEDRNIEKMKNITSKDLQNALEKYFSPGSHGFFLLSPSK